MRVAILGGGGFRVPLLVAELAARPDLAVDDIVLYDLDPRRMAAIATVVRGRAGARVSATTDLRRALAGSDIVFSALRVGGADGRIRDERRALELGLVGQETVGAGGLAFALRTLPVAIAAAHVQADVAPDAWLINFTNPAGIITQALAAVLGPRVIGICDSPSGLIRRVCRALGVDEQAAIPHYLGINHLGWLRSVHVAGRDRLPELLSDPALLESFEEGRLFGSQLLLALDCIPNEYLYFYYCATDVVDRLQNTPTRGERVATDQVRFYEYAERDPVQALQSWQQARMHREESYLAEARPAGDRRDHADLTGGGYQEVAVQLIDALTGGPPVEAIVNTRNGSTLPQLPADTAVEVRCRVASAGATPLPQPAPLTLHQLGLIASVRAAEEAIVAAISTRSRAEAVRGFAIHPLVASWSKARTLVESVLADHPELARLLR